MWFFWAKIKSKFIEAMWILSFVFLERSQLTIADFILEHIIIYITYISCRIFIVYSYLFFYFCNWQGKNVIGRMFSNLEKKNQMRLWYAQASIGWGHMMLSSTFTTLDRDNYVVFLLIKWENGYMTTKNLRGCGSVGSPTRYSNKNIMRKWRTLDRKWAKQKKKAQSIVYCTKS